MSTFQKLLCLDFYKSKTSPKSPTKKGRGSKCKSAEFVENSDEDEAFEAGSPPEKKSEEGPAESSFLTSY